MFDKLRMSEGRRAVLAKRKEAAEAAAMEAQKAEDREKQYRSLLERRLPAMQSTAVETRRKLEEAETELEQREGEQLKSLPGSVSSLDAGVRDSVYEGEEDDEDDWQSPRRLIPTRHK